MAVEYKIKSRIVGGTSPDTSGVSGVDDTSELQDGNIIDPAAVGAASDSSGNGETPKRRGRPRKEGSTGETKERKPRKSKVDLAETLQGTLIFAHIGLAMATKTPELALTSEQATALAKATADVLSFYDTEVPAKTMAWMNLAMCAGGIYFEKLGAVAMRKRAEAARQVHNPAVMHKQAA